MSPHSFTLVSLDAPCVPPCTRGPIKYVVAAPANLAARFVAGLSEKGSITRALWHPDVDAAGAALRPQTDDGGHGASRRLQAGRVSRSAHSRDDLAADSDLRRDAPLPIRDDAPFDSLVSRMRFRADWVARVRPHGEGDR